MRRLAFVVLFLCGSSVSAADPAREISQKDRRFAPDSIALAPGQPLRILNDDRFIHHVQFTADGKEFDSGDQRPGEAVEVKFPGAGDYDLRCAIHPKMKLRVTVGPEAAPATP